jgi:hypothetical protein
VVSIACWLASEDSLERILAFASPLPFLVYASPCEEWSGFRRARAVCLSYAALCFVSWVQLSSTNIATMARRASKIRAERAAAAATTSGAPKPQSSGSGVVPKRGSKKTARRGNMKFMDGVGDPDKIIAEARAKEEAEARRRAEIEARKKVWCGCALSIGPA